MGNNLTLICVHYDFLSPGFPDLRQDQLDESLKAAFPDFCSVYPTFQTEFDRYLAHRPYVTNPTSTPPTDGEEGVEALLVSVGSMLVTFGVISVLVNVFLGLVLLAVGIACLVGMFSLIKKRKMAEEVREAFIAEIATDVKSGELAAMLVSFSRTHLTPMGLCVRTSVLEASNGLQFSFVAASKVTGEPLELQEPDDEFEDECNQAVVQLILEAWRKEGAAPDVIPIALDQVSHNQHLVPARAGPTNVSPTTARQDTFSYNFSSQGVLI